MWKLEGALYGLSEKDFLTRLPRHGSVHPEFSHCGSIFSSPWAPVSWGHAQEADSSSHAGVLPLFLLFHPSLKLTIPEQLSLKPAFVAETGQGVKELRAPRGSIPPVMEKRWWINIPALASLRVDHF